MPKYWGGNYFAHGSFPEVGQKQKTEKKKEKDRKLVITMAKLRMAHASTHGASKPPGPKKEKERLNNGNNNDQLPDMSMKGICTLRKDYEISNYFRKIKKRL